MGKRGPAPQGEYENKSQVLSTRIRADTRASPVAASKKTGRSLSQEIEHRLRRTFIEDDKIDDAFGNRRNYLLMRMVALALEGAYNPENSQANWLDDPVCFDMATRCANKILEALRPEAPIPPASNDLFELIRRGKPLQDAANLMLAAQNADPGLSLFEGTKADHFRGILKAELGAVGDRPQFVMGTGDDHRNLAAELAAVNREEETSQDHAAAEEKRREIRKKYANKGQKEVQRIRNLWKLFNTELTPEQMVDILAEMPAKDLEKLGPLFLAKETKK